MFQLHLIICVQEGLAGREALAEVGYRRIIGSDDEVTDSTGRKCVLSQSIGDMVYGHQQTLKALPESEHNKLLINELYIRAAGTQWDVVESGIEQTSSDLELTGGKGTDRVSGHLAIRTVAWVHLKAKGAAPEVPAVWILNTHLSGGRFEDQFYLQQLAQERYDQTGRVIDLFNRRAGKDDFGIMVGDFNATTDYSPSRWLMLTFLFCCNFVGIFWGLF